MALCIWTACYFLILAIQLANSQSVCQNMTPSPFLEKFVDPLPVPQSIILSSNEVFSMGMYKITQKLHRDLPETSLYAFGPCEANATFPGPTLVATRFEPVWVSWENYIPDIEHMFTVDRTLDWANPPNGGIPTVTHLHGGEDPSTSDGNPDAWFTPFGDRGPAWSTPVYYYPNSQSPTMLWYHDHAVGITRLNVHAGLAGAYILTWPQVENQLNLPSDEFEIPLIISDRQFYPNGSFNYPNVGLVPEVHPNWCPEFFGDTILVNGMVWPYLNVQNTTYRFRILDASNARFYTLFFNSSDLFFTRIGSDGGYLPSPVNSSSIDLAPAYRVDVLVDFSLVPPGTDILLMNSAPAPFPGGDAPSNGTEVVIKFHVVPSNISNSDINLNFLPSCGNASGQPNLTRYFTLNENTTAQNQSLGLSIDNKGFHDPADTFSTQNTAEIWNMINPTGDAHPMHIHLVQFQVLDVQPFNVTSYQNNSCSIEAPYGEPSSCFTGSPIAPSVDEIGWKDTVRAMPGNVTRVFISFTSQNGSQYPFDPTIGPGYVWHCHILEHEDNDMMRPFFVVEQTSIFTA